MIHYKIIFMGNTNRREFIKNTGTFSAMAFLTPSIFFSTVKDDEQVQKWLKMMKDPVHGMIHGTPVLEDMLQLFPRPQGDAAIDPGLVKANMDKLETDPEINTGHPFLDLSIRTGLAHIDATFRGDHPKYGTGVYALPEHEGFPPVIISAVDALSAWGMNKRAAELFRYWLTSFVSDNGTIDYYGPSISEYGQLLHTARLLAERAGGDGWLDQCMPKLNLMVEYLLELHSEALKDDGLIAGVPEADTRDQVAKYFHNNAWVVKGLRQWADLCEKTRSNPATRIEVINKTAQKLEETTFSAIKSTWPADPADWWLPARLGDIPRPQCLTDGMEASYTNYRYWPELLSGDILPADMANRLVNARLNGGGQFCGMTRFLSWLDDWPLADYLHALWYMGRRDDFLLSLFGHIAYHKCEGHLTAFEQISFPGDPMGSKRADYCLPCQLVAARAGRLINKT